VVGSFKLNVVYLIVGPYFLAFSGFGVPLYGG
jgi:hypothetical protein